MDLWHVSTKMLPGMHKLLNRTKTSKIVKIGKTTYFFWYQLIIAIFSKFSKSIFYIHNLIYVYKYNKQSSFFNRKKDNLYHIKLSELTYRQQPCNVLVKNCFENENIRKQ